MAINIHRNTIVIHPEVDEGRLFKMRLRQGGGLTSEQGADWDSK